MNINDIDFNKLYMEQKRSTTFQPKSKKEWDKKAVHISDRIHKSIYNEELINIIDTKDCKSMLDVGCGVGNISLLLSNRLEKIYALDFSTVMLENLKKEMQKRDITNITPINLSWEDEWDSVPNCDIVLASRSMEVANMKDALEKINDKANKRVYLTYKVGGSFLNDDILNYIGKKINKKPDYIYTVNILYQMGINPTINYIKSEGKSNQYENENAFIQSILWSVGELNDKQMSLLKEYYKKFIKNAKEQKDYLCWAVISWHKESPPCL